MYSRDGIEIVEHPDIAEVTAGLYVACEEEIKNRREEYMVVYQSVAHPDPMERIADAFEEIAGAMKGLNDPDMLVEIAKKAGLVGKPAAHKEPVKLELAKKE